MLSEYALEPFTAKVYCNGFNYEYDSSTNRWNPIQMTCKNMKNASKENCNNINLNNAECCFDNYLYKCQEYGQQVINYEGYENDEIKDKKISIIFDYISGFNDKTELPDDDTIISYLEESKSEMELDNSRVIECKTYSKTIDYSQIEYTIEDIQIGKNENFCGKFKEGASKDQCLNRIVFSDLSNVGEKMLLYQIIFRRRC